MRKIRQEVSFFERTRSWLSFRRVAAASAVAIVVIWSAIAAHHSVPQASPSEPDVVAKIDPQDYDVVADLDELIAWDENNLWDEKSNKPSL